MPDTGTTELSARLPKHEPLLFDPSHSIIRARVGTRIISDSDNHYCAKYRTAEEGKRHDEEVEAARAAIIRQLGPDYYAPKGDDYEGRNMDKERYTTKKSARDAYISMMERTIAVAQKHRCHILGISGNHDDGKKIITRQKELQGIYPDHYSYHPVMVRIGQLILTHGDLPLRAGTDGISMMERIPGREKLVLGSMLERTRFKGLLEGENQMRPLDGDAPLEQIKRGIENQASVLGGRHFVQMVERTAAYLKAYDPQDPDQETRLQRGIHKFESWLHAVGVGDGLQAIEDIMLKDVLCAESIYKALREVAAVHPEILGATDVVYGHTHIPSKNIMFGGMRFHNTGTSVKGVESSRYKPLLFTVRERGVEVQEVNIKKLRNGEMEVSVGRVQGRAR